MKTLSRQPDRDVPAARSTGRVILVMALACVAFALLSTQVVAAEDTIGRVDTTAPVQTSVWAETYATVARRADSGSADAARLALEMHRLGPCVYGMSFPAAESQLKRWRRQVDCAEAPCEDVG